MRLGAAGNFLTGEALRSARYARRAAGEPSLANMITGHNGEMDAQQADLLRAIDPKVLGQRLRAARVAAGMTQGQAAADDVTVGYVSRIEAGQRRPNAKVLELLA